MTTASLGLIAVTGGAGFIGRRIIACLLAQGYRVRALQNRQVLNVADVEIVRGSLTDAASLTALVANADTVIHAGALVAARREGDFMRINADGTDALATAATAAGVKRLLLISSLAAARPGLSPYAASKRAAELRLADHLDLAWDIIRPPAVYGDDDPHLLTLFKLLRRRIALVPSGGHARVSLLQVDDLARAVCAWVNTGQAIRHCYELDDCQPGMTAKSWAEIMRLAAQLLQVRPLMLTPPRWVMLALGAVSEWLARLHGRVPFITRGKARELLAGDWDAHGNAAFTATTGWRPQVALADGLALTLATYRQRRQL